jgi:hypothetical protein
MDELASQLAKLYAKIVINCEPTYTPDRGRFWGTDRILRCHRNYPEI